MPFLEHLARGYDTLYTDYAVCPVVRIAPDQCRTAEQVDRLRQMQCPHGQGFWFSRPLNVAAAEELIASSPTW